MERAPVFANSSMRSFKWHFLTFLTITLNNLKNLFSQKTAVWIQGQNNWLTGIHLDFLTMFNTTPFLFASLLIRLLHEIRVQFSWTFFRIW